MNHIPQPACPHPDTLLAENSLAQSSLPQHQTEPASPVMSAFEISGIISGLTGQEAKTPECSPALYSLLPKTKQNQMKVISGVVPRIMMQVNSSQFSSYLLRDFG